MGKLSGKKLLLLGERDGVPGPAMADVFANSGAKSCSPLPNASSERPQEPWIWKISSASRTPLRSMVRKTSW